MFYHSVSLSPSSLVKRYFRCGQTVWNNKYLEWKQIFIKYLRVAVKSYEVPVSEFQHFLGEVDMCKPQSLSYPPMDFTKLLLCDWVIQRHLDDDNEMLACRIPNQCAFNSGRTSLWRNASFPRLLEKCPKQKVCLTHPPAFFWEHILKQAKGIWWLQLCDPS